MFVGREKELQKLNELYQSDQFEFVVFYGRRRVGKTTLIREFMQEKKGIYYMAVEGAKKENLSGLSEAFATQEEQAISNMMFRDYEALLGHIDDLARRDKRVVVAIDEYPYLAASYPAISSMIQKHIDIMRFVDEFYGRAGAWV